MFLFLFLPSSFHGFLFNIQMFAAIDSVYIFFIICLHSRNIYFLYSHCVNTLEKCFCEELWWRRRRKDFFLCAHESSARFCFSENTQGKSRLGSNLFRRRCVTPNLRDTTLWAACRLGSVSWMPFDDHRHHH